MQVPDLHWLGQRQSDRQIGGTDRWSGKGRFQFPPKQCAAHAKRSFADSHHEIVSLDLERLCQRSEAPIERDRNPMRLDRRIEMYGGRLAEMDRGQVKGEILDLIFRLGRGREIM